MSIFPSDRSIAGETCEFERLEGVFLVRGGNRRYLARSGNHDSHRPSSANFASLIV
jgi:hypothetical protein